MYIPYLCTYILSIFQEDCLAIVGSNQRIQPMCIVKLWLALHKNRVEMRFAATVYIETVSANNPGDTSGR